MTSNNFIVDTFNTLVQMFTDTPILLVVFILIIGTVIAKQMFDIKTEAVIPFLISGAIVFMIFNNGDIIGSGNNETINETLEEWQITSMEITGYTPEGCQELSDSGSLTYLERKYGHNPTCHIIDKGYTYSVICGKTCDVAINEGLYMVYKNG